MGLQAAHDKVQEYFLRVRGLMAALIVHIVDPWAREAPPSTLLDCAQGKMVVYYYERPLDYRQGDRIPASFAISFGNCPLTTEDCEIARNITGVSADRFVGYGARPNDPPCTAPRMTPLYILTIPAVHILAEHFTEADALASATMAQLLQTVNNDVDALALSIDLFELKKEVILYGAYRENVIRAAALHQALPQSPQL